MLIMALCQQVALPDASSSSAALTAAKQRLTASRQCAVDAIAMPQDGSRLYIRFKEEVTVNACRCWVARISVHSGNLTMIDEETLNKIPLPPWFHREATGAEPWWLGVV